MYSNNRKQLKKVKRFHTYVGGSFTLIRSTPDLNHLIFLAIYRNWQRRVSASRYSGTWMEVVETHKTTPLLLCIECSKPKKNIKPLFFFFFLVCRTLCLSFLFALCFVSYTKLSYIFKITYIKYLLKILINLFDLIWIQNSFKFKFKYLIKWK